jgi:hypothetical protein
MTTPDIAGLCERLRAALEGVTPGRWVSNGTSVEVFRGGTLFTSYCGNAKSEDFAFITLSREAVPTILDTLERQAAEIERLRGALGYIVRERDRGTGFDRVRQVARAALTGEDA